MALWHSPAAASSLGRVRTCAAPSWREAVAAYVAPYVQAMNSASSRSPPRADARADVLRAADDA